MSSFLPLPRGAGPPCFALSRREQGASSSPDYVGSPLLLPRPFLLTCRRLGVRLTPQFLLVWVGGQRVDWCVRERGTSDLVYRLRRHLVASTSRFGVGEQADSHRTPRGLHRVARKVGGGWPVGTVFEGRQPVGFTWQGRPDAAIAHRILWLEGLEPGRNRGDAVDSFRRFIYVHGVGDELTLGRPASRGCVHLAAGDLMPLHDALPEASLVWISEAHAPPRIGVAKALPGSR